MKRTGALVLAFAFAVPVAARAAEAAEETERKKLSREETVELFGRLHAAVPGSKTFQARLRRTEVSDIVVGEEPLVYHGELKMMRPGRFRQEITKPRRSLTVVNEADVWIYFPDEREVQHIDLKRGIKGREETSSRSIMPWITFDFEGLASVPALRRILEIVAVDTLGLDNGIARSRALIALVGAATKLLEIGELEERIRVLEGLIQAQRQPGHEKVFPSEHWKESIHVD